MYNSFLIGFLQRSPLIMVLIKIVIGLMKICKDLRDPNPTVKVYFLSKSSLLILIEASLASWFSTYC